MPGFTVTVLDCNEKEITLDVKTNENSYNSTEKVLYEVNQRTRAKGKRITKKELLQVVEKMYADRSFDTEQVFGANKTNLENCAQFIVMPSK